MNAEFHYYAVHALALRAGFSEEEARRIATSSQYVDNSLQAWEIEEGGRVHEGLVTQNYVFWDDSTARDIYLPFHFIPGDSAKAAAERRDGRASPWTVTPDSPLAKALLLEALKERDLHRIGVALHSYADSWAHQHFSALTEPGNALSPDSPLPAAGHLQALRSPDDAIGVWTDPRLLPDKELVVNRERFLAAAKKIYRYLRTFLGRDFADEDFVLEELGEIWSGSGPVAEDMQARLAEFSIRYDIAPYERSAWEREAGIDVDSGQGLLVGYDKLQWLKHEVLRRARGEEAHRRFRTGGSFAGSELARWYEAARRHREAAFRLMRQAGLPLAEVGA